MRSNIEHSAAAQAIVDGLAQALIRCTQQLVVIKGMVPGHFGTKRWASHHGDKLLCFRYLQYPQLRGGIGTVELEVDRAPKHRNSMTPTRWPCPSAGKKRPSAHRPECQASAGQPPAGLAHEPRPSELVATGRQNH